MAEENIFDLFTHHLGEFKKLKKAVIRLYRFWVLNERQQGRDETDMFSQQKSKRKHLENSVSVLRNKLNAMSKNYKKENKRIVKENVTLIEEINNLNQERHRLEDKLAKIKDIDDTDVDVGRPPRAISRAKSARQPGKGAELNRMQ